MQWKRIKGATIKEAKLHSKKWSVRDIVRDSKDFVFAVAMKNFDELPNANIAEVLEFQLPIQYCGGGWFSQCSQWL
jgi:hypothetical protein